MTNNEWPAFREFVLIQALALAGLIVLVVAVAGCQGQYPKADDNSVKTHEQGTTCGEANLSINVSGDCNNITINGDEFETDLELAVMNDGASGAIIWCEGAQSVTWTAECVTGSESGSIDCLETGVTHDPCPSNKDPTTGLDVENTATYTATNGEETKTESMTMIH